jgi:hypothetical protein
MGRENSKDGVQMGSERSFSFVFAVIFLVVALWPLWHGGPLRTWALVAAALLTVVGVICPWVLKPFNVAWFHLGIWIGKITTPILMILVFVLVVVPTGILLSAFGKDPMRRRIDRTAASYWLKRDQQPGSMKAQF